MPRSDAKIRRARLGDLDALCALENYFPSDRLNRKHLRHLLKHGHADIWVYQNKDVVIGNAVVLYRRGARLARLYSLVTHPDQRSRGIGTALLATAELAARKYGFDRLALEVRPDNVAARRLYENHGYLVVREIRKFYEDGGPALRLEASLLRTRGPSFKQPPEVAAADSAALHTRCATTQPPPSLPVDRIQ